MRIVRAGFVLLLLAIPVIAQPPGGDFGGRGGGAMKMFMSANPDDIFNQFSKGKDVIRRADLDPMAQMFFDRATRQMNITNGEISRSQFKDAFGQFQSRAQSGGFGGFGGGGGPPSGEMQDRFAEQRFRSYDKNNDGLLSSDEMPDALKNERDKWDTNKDGFIDLNEFKGYFKSRFEQRGDRPDSPAGSPEQPNNINNLPAQDQGFDIARPVVYRAGRLPTGLPDWFKQLDTDNDGQVGLYEWVKGGKAVSEFRDMDYNDDGFITAEESLRFANGGRAAPVNVTSNNASTPNNPMQNVTLNSGNMSFRGPGGDRPRGDTNGNAGGGNGNSGGWGRWMGGMGKGGSGKDGGKDGGPRRGPGDRGKGDARKT